MSTAPQIEAALSAAQLTEVRNEVISVLSNAGILTTEVSTPELETYFRKFPRGSYNLYDKDGNVAIGGYNSELAPNLGNLSLGSSGNMKIYSGHAIIICASGHLKTGGGKGGSEDEKSITISANGDIHIESKGKGGIFIKSAGDLNLEGDNVRITGTTGVSINAGAQTDVPGGEIKKVGSGKISFSAGIIESSSNNLTQQTLSLSKTINYGQSIKEQKINPLKPALPQQQSMHYETPGSVEHNISGDYVLNIQGKMLVNVNGVTLPGSLLSGGGTYGIQNQSVVQNINGDRYTYIRPGTIPPTGDDYVEITKGIHHVKSLAPQETSQTGIAFETLIGNIATVVRTQGDIGIQTLTGDTLVQGKNLLLLGLQEVREVAPRINLN